MNHRCFAALLFLGLAPPAAATDLAVVGLHDEDVDLPAQRAMVEAITTGVDALSQFDALDLDEVAARLAGREDVVVADLYEQAGNRLIIDARSLYQQALPEDALALLDAAIDSLETGVRYTRNMQPLWEAHTLAATVHISEGDADSARASVNAAVALLPTRLPDPARVPPEVVALFDEERKAALESTVQLSVSANAVIVGIWIDGQAVRPDSPLRSVPPGVHHVHARDEDGNVAYVRVEIDGDKAVQLDFAPPRLGDLGTTDAGRSRDARALYTSLGRVSRTNLVLLMGKNELELQLQLHAPDVGAFSDPLALELNASTEEVVAAVVDLLSTLPADGTLPPSEATFTALPLSLEANAALSQLLLSPAPPQTVTLPTPDFNTTTGPPPKKKPNWAVIGGVTGGVVAVAIGTTLGIVLSNGRGTGGTVVFGAPP